MVLQGFWMFIELRAKLCQGDKLGEDRCSKLRMVPFATLDKRWYTYLCMVHERVQLIMPGNSMMLSDGQTS